MRIVEEKLKNQLFEWFLNQYLEEKMKDQASLKPKKRLPSAPIQADIKNIFLRYDTQAQLNLADVRPTGFLLKASI